MRRRWLPPVLLALFVSHGLVYLLAKQRHGEESAATSVGSQEGSLPAKSPEREEHAGSALKLAGFRRMLAELEHPGSAYSAQEFQELREELFREWIRVDLRSALDLLHGAETSARYEPVWRALYQEISAQMVKQPQEVLDWIVLRRYGSQSGVVAEQWVDALLDAGQADLVLPGLVSLPPSVSSELFVTVARQANVAQLAQLRSMYILVAPELYFQHMGLDEDSPKNAYATRMAQLAKGDVAVLLDGEENEEIRARLVQEWASKEAFRLPVNAAAEAMLRVPEAERDTAVLYLFYQSQWRGEDRRPLVLLEALDERGLLGSEQTRVASAAAGQLRYSAQSSDFAEVLREMQVIQRDELRELVLERVLKFDGSIAEESFLNQIASLPAGRDRDALLAGATRNSDCTPELRERFLAQIGNADLVKQLRSDEPTER